ARGQVAGAKESDGRFVACGISLVAHMMNPYVPAVHMNLRYLSTSGAWFGGGSDLTPTFPFAEDTDAFHAALKAACDRYRPDAYQEFKAWCDRYFYLPHRQEPRGVGGLFFDDLAGPDPAADFAFVRSVAAARQCSPRTAAIASRVSAGGCHSRRKPSYLPTLRSFPSTGLHRRRVSGCGSSSTKNCCRSATSGFPSAIQTRSG